MTKYIILFLLIASLVGSCVPLSPTSISLPTAAVSPTIPPSPAPSATPTITPYPGLQTQGPYLLFTNDDSNFTLMDADGSGRRQFRLPNDGYLGWSTARAVSPNGKWLAYYTGAVEQAPYDLALHLYDLENQTTLLVADLIAPGFPENLEPVTKTIDFTDFSGDCFSDLKCQLGEVEFAFRQGVRRLTWSPDGKFLAFAAQIDGPSSDVYIFNVEDQSTRRLTSELENVWSMDWSPDGEKILYLDAVPGTVGLSRYFRVADPNMQTIQTPRQIDGGSFWLQQEGWIDKNSYLIWDGGDGASPHHIRYINTDTQQVREVWKYTAETLIVDQERHQVILVTRPSETEDEKPEKGVYFVSREGVYTKVSDDIYYPFDQDPFGMYFVTYGYAQLAAISTNGTILDLSRKRYDYEIPRVSPDQKWVILPSDMGTELYSKTMQFYRKIWDVPSSKIIWRPDSLGAFLFLDTRMYYLPIPDGEPTLIEDCAPSYCSSVDYAWVP
ncbi:MAG TPA: hypothetical protein VFQ13_10880 [Anaerolineales bacterium]|nr:hypothetical protein [Anaerolineales bacterium]